MTPTFDVGMIGASGTGKTSLLTSMYAQFRSALNETRLSLEPDPEFPLTSQWLQQQRVQLEKISREILVREQGIPGSMESRTLSFMLMTSDAKNFSHLNMRFTDYPGGWLFPAPDHFVEEDKDTLELKERMDASRVMLVAVDTPALLYDNGYYHQQLNRPQQIDELLSAWLRGGRRLLVVFVPLKCERWVRQSGGVDSLYESVESGYEEALSTLRGDPDVAIACAPVQTVGVLEHVRIFDGPNGIESQFRGREARGVFSPEWATEPLRHVLLTLMQLRREKNDLWESFTRLFGYQEDIDHAIDRLREQRMGPSIVWKGASR
jgi:hypothetical protein